MYILDCYKNTPITKKQFSDEEFLALQIFQLENVFHRELCAIKNTNLEYVAISELYAKEFELNNSLSIGKEIILFNTTAIVSPSIEQQEKIIMKDNEYQDSLFLLKKQNKNALSPYALRKRPLINPTTKNIVGIVIVATKYKSALIYKQYLKRIFSIFNKNIKPTLDNISLGEQQRQIILCLMLGYHSRKEISNILSLYTQKSINERRVKTELEKLYEKFECGNTEMLIQFLVNSEIDIELPPDILKEGNHPI